MIEYERRLLSQILKNPSIVDESGLNDRDFTDWENRRLFQLICRVRADGGDGNADDCGLRVYEEKWENAGPFYTFIMDTYEFEVTSVNWAYNLERMRLAQRHRRMKSLLEAEKDATPDDLADSLARLSAGLSELADAPDNSLLRIADTGPFIRQELLRRFEHKGIMGVTTGLSELDEILGGFQPSDLVILAARPAMGKTALAIQFALSAAYAGKRALFFTMEMSSHQILFRMVSLVAEVEGLKLRDGSTDEWDLGRIDVAIADFEKMDLLVDETPALQISQLRAKCLANRKNLGLVVVDYLQLMDAPEGGGDRVQAISAISRGLKALAKELNVPVLALSQLSRSVESRQDKRPMPSDLRESGAIEQDADVILFIYRDEYYNKNSTDRGIAEIIVSKHRSGATGTVKATYDAQYTKFRNRSNDEPF